MKRLFMSLLIVTLALVLTIPRMVFAAEVENVKISQVGNNVVATYDLVGEKGGKSDIIVNITIGNEKRNSDELSLTGDFGKGVKVGKGKKIVWKAKKDLPADFDGDLRWDVKTDSQVAEELERSRAEEKKKKEIEDKKAEEDKKKELERQQALQQEKQRAQACAYNCNTSSLYGECVSDCDGNTIDMLVDCAKYSTSERACRAEAESAGRRCRGLCEAQNQRCLDSCVDDGP
ncbi:MAG: hypothetical protein HQK96_00615 [Nitrospirae bacterium]|nr:hypothetical protein [Nitrospirota bacterium]